MQIRYQYKILQHSMDSVHLENIWFIGVSLYLWVTKICWISLFVNILYDIFSFWLYAHIPPTGMYQSLWQAPDVLCTHARVTKRAEQTCMAVIFFFWGKLCKAVYFPPLSVAPEFSIWQFLPFTPFFIVHETIQSSFA